MNEYPFPVGTRVAFPVLRGDVPHVAVGTVVPFPGSPAPTSWRRVKVGDGIEVSIRLDQLTEAVIKEEA